MLIERAVPAWTGIDLVDRLRERAMQRGTVAHFAAIVLIVAIAVVLVAGIVAYALILNQCIKHGYSHVEAWGPNSWKVWEFRIVCTK